MREIKFRAWDAVNKRMLTSECVDLLIDLQGRLNSHDLGILNGYDNTPQYPLMQYTGLKDKNGKEIYEGDVVKQSGDGVLDGRIYQVVFKIGSFFMSIRPLCDVYLTYELEVIGNIYENKDLLEGIK